MLPRKCSFKKPMWMQCLQDLQEALEEPPRHNVLFVMLWGFPFFFLFAWGDGQPIVHLGGGGEGGRGESRCVVLP